MARRVSLPSLSGGASRPSLSGDALLSMSLKLLTFCIIDIMKEDIFPVNRDIDDQIDEFEAIGIV